MPRTTALALAAFVSVVLVWRVVVAGLDAQSDRDIARRPSVSRVPLGATGAHEPWRQRLARNPADATALMVLALELERQGKADEAGAAVQQALNLAPKDPQMLLQGVGYFLRNGNETQALETLREVVESSTGEVSSSVWNVFTTALDSGHHQEFFDAIARDDPNWWPGFFRLACEQAANAGAVSAVFAARIDAGVFTTDELRCMIGRLQRDGEWTAAYQLWLNTLPLDQRQKVGYVFNGGFEYPISNLGFDWQVPAQDAVVVSTVSIEGMTGRQALSVTFVNRRVAIPPIQQFMMLVPGRYQFVGRGRTDLEIWLGLQWGLYCNDAPGREPRPLSRSERFVGTADWKEFRHDFTVPDDCPVQLLRLEPANLRREGNSSGAVAARLRGRAWFDDLRVRILD